MVSVVETMPQTLLDKRDISLHDLIVFDLLLEIDALDFHFGEKVGSPWEPNSKSDQKTCFDGSSSRQSCIMFSPFGRMHMSGLTMIRYWVPFNMFPRIMDRHHQSHFSRCSVSMIGKTLSGGIWKKLILRARPLPRLVFLVWSFSTNRKTENFILRFALHQ